MNCASIKKWLLDADSLQKADWPSDVATHVKTCAGCTSIAKKLRQIERNLRDQPLPPECAKSKQAFLKKHRKPKHDTTPAPQPSSRQYALWFLLPASGVGMAAAVFIGITILAWMVFSPTPVQASGDIVDRLIDWNIELASADLPKRKKLVEERGPEFKNELQKVQKLLSEDELELANNLIESGHKFADVEDPVAEVERITELRDKLSDRAEIAEKKGKPREFERCEDRFGKINDFTKKFIDTRMAAFKGPPMPFGKKEGPEHWANMKKQFERFAERERDWRELGKRPDMNFKKGWPKGGKK